MSFIQKHSKKSGFSFRVLSASHSAKNISEISLEVGLNDQNYFTRLFKEFMHVTPRYYREHWEEIETWAQFADIFSS